MLSLQNEVPTLRLPLYGYDDYVDLPDALTSKFKVLLGDAQPKSGEYTFYNESYKVVSQRDDIRERVSEVAIPGTKTWEEFLADPSLPVVCKLPLHYGRGKWLLDNANQIEKLKRFFVETNASPDLFTFQEYILSPTECPSSVRILANAAGRIILGYILCSRKKSGIISCISKRDAILPSGLSVLDLLNHPHSDFYLEGTDIRSNVCGQTERTEFYPIPDINLGERGGLKPTAKAYLNANPNCFEELLSAASKIAVESGRKQNLYVAIDLLLSRDGQIYWLETNSRTDLSALVPIGSPGAEVALRRNLITTALEDILNGYSWGGC